MECFVSVSGIYDSKNYPTDYLLNLKVGAQIIFSSNDKEKRWANGTVGIIHELTKKAIKVKLENGSIHEIKKETWQNYKYTFDYLKFSYKPNNIHISSNLYK